MPTYEYQCEACGQRMEEFQSMSAKPLRKCPECGKPKLKRLIGTGAGVIFKGSGFYQTDYRSDSYKKSAEAEKKPPEVKSAEVKPVETKSAETKKTEMKAESKKKSEAA
ncbi:MAG: zinc ribbon domain-containing protein [Phycisphaeraceae bacterium]